MNTITATIINRTFNNKLVVFAFYWLLVFIVYLPTVMAGRVGDFPGWVEAVMTRSFADYVNRTGSSIASLYQLTQIISYFFYQLFGANALLWHLLFISLHATNTLLLYSFFRHLFDNAGIQTANLTALAGGILFCLSPSISEIIVWEPAFHYLLALLFMMGVLICCQQFIITDAIKFAWWGNILFFLSTYSLEIFYLTPMFTLITAIYYQIASPGKPTLKRVFTLYLLPQAFFFLLHIALLQIVYHKSLAHVGSIPLSFDVTLLYKPLKLIFHVLFFGRFLPTELRMKMYHLCENEVIVGLFYSIIFFIMVYSLLRFRKLKKQWLIVVALLAIVLLSLALITPLWLPDSGIVICDRYTYLFAAFVFMLISLVFASICRKHVFIGLIILYALANYRFTHRANAHWQQSADIVNNLVSTFPNDTSKKVLLVNLPECLGGVQMIGTRDDGEFRMLYNSVREDKITNEVYDVEAFYMSSPADGAHVNVVDDTTIRVTLNQWGTWWLYYGYGATSYENKDFKVIMRDQGHWYDLILKHPASEYIVLYTVGREWRKADLSKKGIDQY